MTEGETHLPRREGSTSHVAPDAAQLVHGCLSVTLHFTRRELHSRQACFARVFLGFAAPLPPADAEGAIVCGRRKSGEGRRGEGGRVAVQCGGLMRICGLLVHAMRWLCWKRLTVVQNV